MSEYFHGYGNYEQNPTTKIKGFEDKVWNGYELIKKEIESKIAQGDKVFVFDFYPGVDKNEVVQVLNQLNPSCVIDAEEAALTGEQLTEKFWDNITDDRVFGTVTLKTMIDCYDAEKLVNLQEKLKNEDGVVFVVGTGAGLVTTGDVYLYFDLARWEIQGRYRKGMPNWRCDNVDEPALGKVKRGYFMEWRIADRHKRAFWDKIDYLVDTNIANEPKMISGEAFCEGLNQLSCQPFRLRPFFDEGIWGGQWMRDVCGLSDEKENYAWCFDGVPEENSLLLEYGGVTVEIPANDLVFYRPAELLGESVYGRFGNDFPIRFNMLDLMEGGNLSLQVHPMTNYVQNVFGINYTQDESYYILDANEEGSVYLGVKDGVKKEEFIENLLESETGKIPFNSDKFINNFPVKKHDHVSIPGGTIHSSGKNTMVLEISSTPNMFTFKLWDWGRVGKDGVPRPIHTKHGINNIQWERDTTWIKNNILPNPQKIHEEDGVLLERTGLHKREFIDSFVYTFDKEVLVKTGESVNVNKLVAGSAVEISSPTGQFETRVFHYIETFIVPANVKEYIIKPVHSNEKEPLKLVVAKVRC